MKDLFDTHLAATALGEPGQGYCSVEGAAAMEEPVGQAAEPPPSAASTSPVPPEPGELAR